MIKYIILRFLSLFDTYHKYKILRFLKAKNINELEVFFDIGAHNGESIELFASKFTIKEFYSFEASPINFKVLHKNHHKFKNKFKNTSIKIENIAVGSENKKGILKQTQESSSSTLSNINQNSKYFKKKKRILNLTSQNKSWEDIEVSIKTLENYLKLNNIKKIDFLKIDTEGSEYEILLGLKDKLNIVNIILFEHHYDDMISKNYTFRDINYLLKKNKFEKVYKSKMPFRKTFEYIYINREF